MEKTLFTEDHFWSAVKRKNLPNVLEIVFAQAGYDEAAKIAHDTKAMTDAAIKRMRVALGTLEAVEEKFEEPLPEFAEAAVEDNELLAIHTDIENLLAKGKGKKALKLIKASMANGTKGSVIKEQLAKAKQLKKEAK